MKKALKMSDAHCMVKARCVLISWGNSLIALLNAYTDNLPENWRV
jgi:hypothetical protein